MSVTIPRLAALAATATVACLIASSAWSNGDGFFRSTETPGNPVFVIFGNVKDDQGKYLDNAIVKVTILEHVLTYAAKTDVLGRYRTPDVGLAISDLGYAVDPSIIEISVACPGYRELRREYRGKYRQTKGAVEMNFIMTLE